MPSAKRTAALAQESQRVYLYAVPGVSACIHGKPTTIIRPKSHSMSLSPIDRLPALFTAFVWGSTFAASKVALEAGLSPITLMTLRFALAYALLLAMTRGKDFLPTRGKCLSEKVRFALPYVGLGLCGGSLYFLAEYEALRLTSSVNVCIITSAVPVVTTTILVLTGHARVGWNYYTYSALALVGVTLVIVGGSFAFQFSPLGDLIAVGATVLWALYSIILDRMDGGENSLVVSRRLFFWALLTIMPFFLANVEKSELECLKRKEVLFAVGYLGCIASAACIWLWDVSVRRLGAIESNKFLYLMPVVSLVAGAVLMGGEVSWWNAAGGVAVVVSARQMRGSKPSGAAQD